MTEQRILLGSTQSLLTYPRVSPGGPWLRGVPSSATVRVGTPAVSMPTSTSAATVDATSTTTNAAAAEGATSLAGVTMTAVLGRRYLVGPTGGPYTEVVSSDVGSKVAGSLVLAEPLPAALASGSAVLGWAITAALTAPQTATRGNGLAMFSAVVDGVTYEWAHSFRIVRRILTSTLTPTKLTQAWPAVRQMRSRSDASFEEIIDAAWEHRIAPWLAANDIDEEDVIPGDTLEPLHAVACVLQLAEANAAIPRDLVATIQARWDRLSETTLARKDWYEAPQDETPQPRPEERTEVRGGIRLTR